MNSSYDVTDDKPVLVENPDINLGVAIDVTKGDQRQLLVPNIKACEDLNFAQFYAALEQGSEDYLHARDGLMSIQLIDAIQESGRTGRAVAL